MKPDWDELSAQYEDSSSVVIGDVDCTVQEKLCSDFGVRGYPTIKVFDGTEKDGKGYEGGRDLASLQSYVADNLEAMCTVDDQENCSEREVKFIKLMQKKGADVVEKQLTRLSAMTGKSMSPKNKGWLVARIRILKNLSEGGEKEEL